MRNISTIFRRELNAYFNSAIAYIFIIVFLLISVGLFMTQFFLVSVADMRGFFVVLPLILCVFLPAVTMRLWAEDRKGNTLELLLTFPVKTYELVLGKFFASFVFYVVALLSTITVPFMILFLGDPDVGVFLSQYIGAILLGAFFLSLGLFVSGFCKDQIVSFIVSMLLCFSFFLVGTELTASSIDGWIPGLGSFLRSSLGLLQHFDSFQKGVIDNRDILYFLIGAVIFLGLNGFYLDIRSRPKSKTGFIIICFLSLGIFILINLILVDMPIGRFDTTEGKLYTMSEATKKILSNLDAPVIAKLYISPPDKMPTGLKTLERSIRDKLDEFKVSAKGKFKYKVFHMEAANVVGAGAEESLEKTIEKKGIRPFQVRSVEADEVGVKLVYSALSLAYREKEEEIIPQIIPAGLIDLEYNIISKIYKMALKESPKVALVTPYTERVITPKLKEVLKELPQSEARQLRDDPYEYVPRILEYGGYTVSRIKLTKEQPIPDDTDTLIILEPKDLNERQRFEINRFLVNGGSVFLAVQRYNFTYRPIGATGLSIEPIDQNPRINDLLEQWGIGISKDFLMDTQMDVVTLTGGLLFGIFPLTSPVKIPIQIKVVSEQMNKEIPITSRLSTMLYLWGTAIELNKEKLSQLKLKVENLINSSPQAWTVKYHSGDLTSWDLSLPSKDKMKSYPLAVLVEGQFPNAFKDKEIPKWPKVSDEEESASYEEPKEKLKIEPKPGRMILVGCAQMFTRELIDKGGHLTFFLNSIDALSLGQELIKVRSKQPIDRSLKRISPMAKAGWRIFTTFFIPAILCIIGGLRIFFRKRSKWVYLRTV